MDDILDKAMQLPNAHRYENYVAAQCPFHDDRKNSLMVYPDWFRCLACDESGPLSKLWTKAKLSTFVPVQTRKAEYYPHTSGRSAFEIARSGYTFLMDNPSYKKYLKERGLEEGIKRFVLGYYEGWYTIPIVARYVEGGGLP